MFSLDLNDVQKWVTFALERNALDLLASRTLTQNES